MPTSPCPQCESKNLSRNGIIKERQRFKCKDCGYNFTVDKIGKSIETYFVVKALQLYLEGMSYREIERLLGVSHVSVMNWVKKYQVKIPPHKRPHPTYTLMNHCELADFYANRENLKGGSMIITEIGDKFILIKWDKFKSH